MDSPSRARDVLFAFERRDQEQICGEWRWSAARTISVLRSLFELDLKCTVRRDPDMGMPHRTALRNAIEATP